MNSCRRIFVSNPPTDSGEEQRALTCRTSLDICPTLTRKLSAAIHSFVLSRVSRAKSWRCVTSRSITYVRRASLPWEFIITVFAVILSIFRSFIGGAPTSVAAMLGDCWSRSFLEDEEEEEETSKSDPDVG
jgi:hypothetical protein